VRKKAERFKDLEVWQKAHRLVLEIYKITKEFPGEEKFGLVSQMRRAGVSIAANIAEGFKKRGPRDKANFYNMAQGSSEELRYYMILSKDLGYVKENEGLLIRIDEIGKMLHGLIESVKMA
jgi:four helix bundle protein